MLVSYSPLAHGALEPGQAKAVPTRPHGSFTASIQREPNHKAKKSSATAAVHKNTTERAALPEQPKMYPDEQAATLAAGKAITKTHTTGTWTIKTKRAPILSVAKRSLAADSQVAWKRELGLGRATNQELPEALYGRNLLALRHDASGVRLAFDALEALRSWALLDAEPIPHRSLAASFRSTA